MSTIKVEPHPDGGFLASAVDRHGQTLWQWAQTEKVVRENMAFVLAEYNAHPTGHRESAEDFQRFCDWARQGHTFVPKEDA